MKKVSVLIFTVLVPIFLLINTPAFALPVVDGFLSVNEYSNSFVAGWYNAHKQADSRFQKPDDHETTVYWENTGGNFYLYLQTPLDAKSMIWGDGVTEEEALLYYQHYSTHHNETFAEFWGPKTTFSKMTGSEKVIFGQGAFKEKDGFQIYDTKESNGFAGIKADLDGDVDIKGGYLGLSLISYADSVDYVTANITGCDTTDCDADDIPMAFEFMFGSLTQTEIDTLISDIKTNELEFHLSPERAIPTPEPATMLLIGGPRAKARLAFGHPPIGRLSSFALTHLTGSAHAPPIKCVRADCDSRHEKKIKNHFLPMPAILAAQQPAVGRRVDRSCRIH